MTLDLLFYLVIIAALVFYAALDGFDLGVGALHLFTKKDEERRLFLNAIGPVWDGNEVWLVIVFGALFAGFPAVYATLLSGFYNLIMGLLFALIFRAVAIEFRSKHDSVRWRQSWDVVFSVASLLIAFGVGLMLGNLVSGVELNREGDFVGSFSSLFKPYSLLLGVMTIALCMMHGAIYLMMKTEGSVHDNLRRWVNRCILFFVTCYLVVTAATIILFPHMIEKMWAIPYLFVVPLFALLAIACIPFLLSKKWDGLAFISSCLSIALLLALFAIGTFPNMILSTIDPEHNSLQIANSASSPLTLKVLLTIVAIGIPLVLAYGYYIYRVFRGKVKLDHTSY
jgi:cytochrome bd ubiquinol oxidase subunit II